jgi:hypothetical protein
MVCCRFPRLAARPESANLGARCNCCPSCCRRRLLAPPLLGFHPADGQPGAHVYASAGLLPGHRASSLHLFDCTPGPAWLAVRLFGCLAQRLVGAPAWSALSLWLPILSRPFYHLYGCDARHSFGGGCCSTIPGTAGLASAVLSNRVGLASLVRSVPCALWSSSRAVSGSNLTGQTTPRRQVTHGAIAMDRGDLRAFSLVDRNRITLPGYRDTAGYTALAGTIPATVIFGPPSRPPFLKHPAGDLNNGAGSRYSF